MHNSTNKRSLMMKKFKKLVTMALALVMSASVSLTAGCGKKDDSADYGDKKEISVSLYFGEFGVDWLKKIAKEWNDSTTSNYYVSVSDHKNLSSTVVKDIQTGTNKDVFIGHDANYQALYSGGYLEDLTDVLSAKPDGGMTVREMITDYELWEKVAVKDGKTYAIPFDLSPMGLVFDYDKFKENGWLVTDADGSVSAGKDGIKGTYDDGQPTTWAEFDAMLAKISLKTSDIFSYMGSVHPEYVNNVVYAYMAQYMGEENYTKFIEHDTKGAEVKLEDGSMASFGIDDGYKAVTMDGVKKSMGFVSDYLANSSYVKDRTLTDGSFNVNNSHVAFLEGESVFLVEGNWWENGSKSLIESLVKYGGKKFGEADYRYMLLPAIEGQNSAADQSYIFSQTGGAIVVPKNKDAEKVKAIKEFLVYMLKEENLVRSTLETGLLWNYKYTISDADKAKMTKFGRNVYEMFHDEDHVTVRSFYLDCASVPYYAYSGAGCQALYTSKNGQIYIVQAYVDAKKNLDTLYTNVVNYTQSNWAGFIRQVKGFGYYA